MALAVGGFFYSCADVNQTQKTITLFQSMDVWMKANRPDIPMIDSGFYYKIYKAQTPAPSPKDTFTVRDSVYVDIKVWGELLDGSVFINSDPLKARELGTFSYSTRYEAFRYLTTDYNNYYFTNLGVNAVLYNMSIGDSAVVYLAPDYSYQEILTEYVFRLWRIY